MRNFFAFIKTFILFFILFSFFAPYAVSAVENRSKAAAGSGEYTVNSISVIHYSGTITAAAADYFTVAFDALSGPDGADMAVIALDTPGGLDSSMRVIIKGLMNLNRPAAVFVSPQGARATSAGVFITMAAPVAAMAPGTSIGAAHPVFAGIFPSYGRDKNKDSETEAGIMEAKVLNDSVAYIRSLAAKTGRNAEWAINSVRSSIAVPADEAVRIGVADFMAEDIDDFIKKLDGRKAGDFGVLHICEGVKVKHIRQGFRDRFMSTVSTPDLAMLLAGAGAAGVFIELYSPGLVLPGVLGAMSLVLSLYSFQTLSASGAGIALIFLAFVFFIAEIKVMSYGLLTVAGAFSMLVGGLMLFEPQASGGLGVSAGLLIGTIISLMAVVAVLAFIVFRAQSSRIVAGIESLEGKKGTAKTDMNPKGKVLAEGELWEAESVSGSIAAGEKVIVAEVKGFRMKVRRDDGVSQELPQNAGNSPAV